MKKTHLHFSLFSIGLLLLTSSTAYAVDVEAGRVTATQCAICHGINGEGNGTPGSDILNLDSEEFKKNIRDFKSGIRRNYMMEKFVKKLSNQDIDNLAAYYDLD